MILGIGQVLHKQSYAFHSGESVSHIEIGHTFLVNVFIQVVDIDMGLRIVDEFQKHKAQVHKLGHQYLSIEEFFLVKSLQFIDCCKFRLIYIINSCKDEITSDGNDIEKVKKRVLESGVLEEVNVVFENNGQEYLLDVP